MCKTLYQIPGFDDYLIDKHGNVYSSKRNSWNTTGKPKRLKAWKNKGYKYVSLYDSNGNAIKKSVARLILITFIGEAPNGMETCHNNGIKDDNRLINLRWDTKKANSADCIKHQNNYMKPGENHPKAKLNELQVRIILAYLKLDTSFGCHKFLKACFNCSYSTLSDIKYKRTWRHL